MKNVPFQADTPEFATLRPAVREVVRESESDCRKALATMLEGLPGEYKLLLGDIMEQLPGAFVRGHLPFYQMVSDLQDQAIQLLANARAAELAMIPIGERPN